jgi:hypothetical protein
MKRYFIGYLLTMLLATIAAANELHVGGISFSFIDDGTTPVTMSFDWDTTTSRFTNFVIDATGPQAQFPYHFTGDFLLSPQSGAITMMAFTNQVGNSIQFAAGNYIAEAFSIYPTPGSYPVAIDTWCSGLPGSGCPFGMSTFFVAQATVSGVPEPRFLVLFGVGLAGVMVLVHRRYSNDRIRTDTAAN